MRAKSGTYFSRAALGFVSASIFGWSAMAAETASIPDFSGIWGRNWPYLEEPPSGPGPVLGKPRRFDAPMIGDYSNPILKPETAEVLRKRGLLGANGESLPDPHNQCLPEPTPFIMTVQFGMQILQEKDQVTLFYIGDHKVRRVRMNQSHPANVTPTWHGDSVGHYEGDTLVIDTVGQKVGPLSVIDIYGTPFTSALRVVERYRLIDGDAARAAVRKHEGNYMPPGMSSPVTNEYGRGNIDPTAKKGLQVEITVEDPGVFTTPWKGLITYLPAQGEWPEAACAENAYDYYDGKSAPIPQADKPDF